MKIGSLLNYSIFLKAPLKPTTKL